MQTPLPNIMRLPWENRTGYLYTVEHFRTVRSRLRPGGIYCQWLALYQVGPEELEQRIAKIFGETNFEDSYLDKPSRILDLAVGRWPNAVDALLNTDEHPRVEFLTPLSHLDRRLLSGNNFKQYFDQVLLNLPPAVDRAEKSEQKSTRKRQRFIWTTNWQQCEARASLAHGGRFGQES